MRRHARPEEELHARRDLPAHALHGGDTHVRILLRELVQRAAELHDRRLQDLQEKRRHPVTFRQEIQTETFEQHAPADPDSRLHDALQMALIFL